MKLLFSIALLGLIAAATGALHAKEISATKPLLDKQPLDQAYLSHWFSFDSAEALDLVLTPLASDEFGERAEIRFTSDDGQLVNGLIAYPSKTKQGGKLALAMHPMGIDQQFWWSDKSPLAVHALTKKLRQQGYVVISLDARQHGQRGRENFGPRELLKRAHSAEPRVYIDTIIGSVRDYRIILNWAVREFSSEEILTIGYSMGAQMSLLLASFEPRIDTIIAMVPPYIGSPTSPVAPRKHVSRINNAKVMWLAGSEDPHSDRGQTQETFDRLSTTDKKIVWFDSGHRLPAEFLDTTLSFLDALAFDVSSKESER